jgi:predicted nucleic-acid-binding protein
MLTSRTSPSQVVWGLDTNVLVRYLVGDDPAQQRIARGVIETEHSNESPALIHPILIVELVWVLRSAYKAPKSQIVDVLDLLLRVDAFRFIDEADFRAAVESYRTHDVDFADALLHAAYQRQGAGLATFDRRAATLSGARLLAG